MKNIIPLLIELGKRERDGKAYNRFRLVVVTPYQSDVTQAAMEIFEESEPLDHKSHIHFITSSEVPSVGRQTLAAK